MFPVACWVQTVQKDRLGEEVDGVENMVNDKDKDMDGKILIVNKSVECWCWMSFKKWDQKKENKSDSGETQVGGWVEKRI